MTQRKQTLIVCGVFVLVFVIGFLAGVSYEWSCVRAEYQLHPWDKSKPIIGLPRGMYRKAGPDVSETPEGVHRTTPETVHRATPEQAHRSVPEKVLMPSPEK